MVGHFIVLLHVMYHNYNLVSLGFKLHNAHTIIIMSSTCFLYIRLHSVSENVLNSLIRLIAFSTLMRMLAISLDCIACCPVSLPSDKKLHPTPLPQRRKGHFTMLHRYPQNFLHRLAKTVHTSHT